MANYIRFSMMLGAVALVMLAALFSASRAVADDAAACAEASGDVAIAACTRIVQNGGTSTKIRAIAYYNRGNLYMSIDLDRAIADYNQAIQVDPKFVDAYYFRGVAYENKEDYDRAFVDFTHTIELDPKYASAYKGRCGVYNVKPDYDRAIADCNDAIRLDPKDFWAYILRGSAYEAKHNDDLGIADYTHAIELDPKSVTAYEDRGVAYSAKGNYDRSIADYNQAIQLNPKNGRFYLDRGRANLYVGALPNALADLNQATSLRPRDAYAALWLDIVGQRNNIPSRLSEAVSTIDMTAWPAPVIRMFLGQMPPAAVLAAADVPNAVLKKVQICEANFYSGELALRQGAKDEATRLFRLVVSDCSGSFIEWIAANAELKALGVAP
jgi:lipoprotein NlpI